LYPVKNNMKILLSIIFVMFLALSIQVSGQTQNRSQSAIQLAVRYYSDKDFEKAAPLFKDVLKLAGNKSYFNYYLNCLIELKRYDEAEKEIKKELNNSQYSASELYINWGYLLKKQGKQSEADERFNLAINSIPLNKPEYLNTANTFIQYQEYEFAKKTYLLAEKKLPGEQFNYEFARVYYYLRDYDNMLEKYLDLLKTDEQVLPQIQSTIGSAMGLDIDNELKGKFRTSVLKRIQSEPNVLGYTKLYIWFLLQEQNFSAALRQSIALDKRTGVEDASISNLASIAANSHNYNEARKAYEYMMSKGEKNPYFLQSFMQNLQISYLMYENGGFNNPEDGNKLAENFRAGLEYIKYSPASYWLVKEYAHLLAFYLKQPDKAIEELNKGISIRGLNPVGVGELKTELADIYVYAGDPWEATLIYSQVIEANKDNALSDQVKLKKARLSYYLGDFKWAQGQLDVLKASTSKLTANDAMELSLMIGNNLNLDTTDVPLQMFSRADFLFFRNEDSLALAIMDSIENIYPYHTLVDDILFRKAKIEIKKGDYTDAVASLEKIITDFSYETLADDALFLLAETYQYNLKDLEKAKELYNRMLVIHPGSVFVVESRKRFRELRGDKVEEEVPKNTDEEIFIKGL
jgi:tetratricopeptide (TPR) repeat protein